LSGGEKVLFYFFFFSHSFKKYQTLSSLSLVFALHHFRPNPLYILDEIDAALDSRNVGFFLILKILFDFLDRIIGQYIRSQTKDAQFIIISLRNDLFELSDRLIGFLFFFLYFRLLLMY
jgi:structural maintenance of chromosome 4